MEAQPGRWFQGSKKPSRARRVAGRAPSWDELLAFAHIELRLTPQRFMRMRPGLFWRLAHSHNRALKRRDGMVEFMVAQLIATVHNTSLAGYKHPIAPRDVMPSHWAKQPKKKRQTKAQRGKAFADQLRSTMKAMEALHGVKTTAPPKTG